MSDSNDSSYSSEGEVACFFTKTFEPSSSSDEADTADKGTGIPPTGCQLLEEDINKILATVKHGVSEITGKIYPMTWRQYLTKNYSALTESVIDVATKRDAWALVDESFLKRLSKVDRSEIPKNLICDIFIVSDSRALLLLSIMTNTAKRSSLTEYNSGLARSFLKIIHSTGMEKYDLVNGILSTAMSELQQSIDRMESEAVHTSIPHSLTMDTNRYKHIISLIMSMGDVPMKSCTPYNNTPEGVSVKQAEKVLIKKEKKDDATESRFKALEQELKANEENCNTHFQLQQKHIEDVTKSLKALTTEVSKLAQSFERDRRTYEEPELVSHLPSFLTSDGSLYQTPEVSMVTSRDINERRCEDMQLLQPISKTYVTNSVSQSPDLAHEKAIDSLVSTTEEVSTEEIQTSLKDDLEKIHGTSSVHFSIPADMKSSMLDENTFTKESCDSVMKTTSSAWTGYSTAESKLFLKAVGVSGSSPEMNRLEETVGFALVDDATMPPKAKGSLTTILCLDASSSMEEEGFEEMKNIACRFVDGVEDIAEHYDIEENISVVAFGGRSRIEHFLTNDYGSIRDAIDNLEFGGRSPLFEALLVSLCAYQSRGGSLSISGVHRIQPRLIIITDGKASDEKEHTHLDVDTVDQNVKMRLIKLMQKFNAKENTSTYPKPVVWIPVGNANVEWIKAMATIGGGEVCSSQDVVKLCKYQRIQETIGRTYAYIKKGLSHDTGDLTDDIKVLIDAFSGDMDPVDKAEVLDTVKSKLEGKHGYDCEDDDPRGWDNIFEFEESELPRLGSRVVRGPHWKWHNQDTNGPGTVVNHLGDQKDWIWVLWDNGNHNRYRYGDGDCYDVVPVKDQPKFIRSDMMIDIGCEVTRGPDWEKRYQDQDGGRGGVGVVIRTNKNGEVKVRWHLTREIGSYRYGKDDKLDLAIRDPVDILKDLTGISFVPSRSYQSGPGTASIQESSDDSQWMWQWKDEAGKWHLYPEEDIHKIETAYRRRPDGSCLIKRCGVSCRVMFKDLIERGIDTGSRIYVQRKRMKEDDILVVKSLQKSPDYM